MKKSNRVIRLCAIVGVISLIAFLFYYRQLPDTVPIHWNAAGEIDNYGPKATMLFFAVMPLLTTALMAALPRLDPKGKNYLLHEKAYNAFTIGLTVCFTTITWVCVVQLNGEPLPVGRILPGLMGILFIILGNWMPQLKPNYFMGIRTPWALENVTVWRKTHRMGGLLFVVFGILMVITALLPAAGFFTLVWVAALLAGCGGLFAYSYLVYKKITPGKDDKDAED